MSTTETNAFIAQCQQDKPEALFERLFGRTVMPDNWKITDLHSLESSTETYPNKIFVRITRHFGAETINFDPHGDNAKFGYMTAVFELKARKLYDIELSLGSELNSRSLLGLDLNTLQQATFASLDT